MNNEATTEQRTAQAVIYLRVSTDRQALTDFDADGYSIKAQRDACLKKAKDLGAIVASEYVDRGESARSADRGEFQRMVDDVIASGEIDYVIVHKLDRFARNRVDDALMTMALQKAGARLVSCSEAIDDSPSGALLHGIMASISEFYSRNLAAEVKKGMEQKVKAGGTPTRAKLGYLNRREVTADGRNVGIVIVDSERAPLIQLAFELYATGEFSYASLCEVLEAKGLRTRPTRKHQGKPLTTSQIDRILRDPYYIGIVRHKGVDYQGIHDPLISETLYEQVQAIRIAHGVSGERRRLHHHWLKGTVYCGSCGSRLIFTRSTNRHGVTYDYFYCVARQHDRLDGGRCQQPWVRAETVEDSVIRHYKTVQLPAKRVEAIREAIRERIGAIESTADRQRSVHAKRIVEIEEEQLRLIQAHGAGAVPIKHLITEQDRLRLELRAVEAALRSTERNFADIQATLMKALDLASDCHRAYELATPDLRRLMDQGFFERILIEDGEVSGSVLSAPFADLLADDLLDEVDQEIERETAPVGLRADRDDVPSSEPLPEAVFSGQGPNEDKLAEGEGFEPSIRRFDV